ncbi:MAG: glucosaminidase domain-containing protein [Oscillospiraceae bacterium]|nr:glucosaminidase domain-containing protein [Oscillospiraceae bacterium]
MNIVKKTLLLAVVMILVFSFSIDVSASQSTYFNTQNLTKPSGLTSAQLEKGLLKSLKPLASEFIKAERKYGVNAIFLASVSALESGWGERGWSYKNNIFGYGGGMKFSSKAQCIDYVASALRKNYLNKSGIYHKGLSVSGVNFYYNGSDFWRETVTDIMYEISDRINREILNGARV